MKNIKLGLVVSVALALTACGGGGGGGSSSTASAPVAQAPVTPVPVQTPAPAPAPTVTPIKVQATSYLNAKNISRAPSALPSFTQPLPYTMVADPSARAFADFEQNGTLSFFEMSLDSNPQNPNQKGTIKFWHDNGNGKFTDITNKLIPNAGDQVGCLQARKVVIADFNQDGKPDIFIACTGVDLPSNPPGEMPMMLLSQPDGTYKVSSITLTNPAFMHGATAADINGDGYPDIIVTDNRQNNINQSPVFILKNNKDGTFTEDHTQFQSLISRSVGDVELIDFKGDGNLELWLTGPDATPGAQFGGGAQSSAWAMTSPGIFSTSPMITFPANQQYPSPLDIVVQNGYAYFNRTDVASDGYAIEKVDLSTCTSTTCVAGVQIYTSTTNFLNSTNPACAGIGGQWIDWFRILNGKIVTDDSCQSPNVAN